MNRLSDRGTYDAGTIHSIVNKASVLHVSFMPSPDDPFPVTLPMIGHLGSFDYPSSGLEDPLDLYLHGYVSSRMMNIARNTTTTLSKNDDDEGKKNKGMPVTIAATIVDGLVLSLTPFSHSYNYRSAMLQGYATLIEDPEEKLYGMRLITNKVLENRWENSRTPPDKGEMSSTSILKVRIVAASAKIREGGPHDDAKDVKNAAVTAKTWTGVIPVWETLGKPHKFGSGEIDTPPAYIVTAVQERKKDAEETAIGAMKDGL